MPSLITEFALIYALKSPHTHAKFYSILDPSSPCHTTTSYPLYILPRSDLVWLFPTSQYYAPLLHLSLNTGGLDMFTQVREVDKLIHMSID